MSTKKAKILSKDEVLNALLSAKLPKELKESLQATVKELYQENEDLHAFMEAEVAVAMPFNDGIFVYSSDQSVYDTKREVSMALGIEPDKVVVENKYVGGGFGGKEDMSVQHYAAIMAYRTKRPVKFKLTRQESINWHPKRHPMSIDMTTACDENGILTAMKATLITDAGAYASLSGPVLQRACTHAAGPYNYQVIDIEGKSFYTNNPPTGPFRGFGVPQSCFATEMNINLLAEMCGLDPWEIRYRNAIRPGQVLPNYQIADEATGLVETLEAVKDIYYNNKNVGIACALKNSGVGVGLPDTGRVRLVVEDENDIAIAIEAYLTNQGYNVFIANNGIEGLEVLKKEIIHLAIVDVMMPKMDGITFVMKLRENHDFPVIMLSAKSEEVDKIMGLNIGADDYVTKPFRPLELLARVNSQLRRYSKFLNMVKEPEVKENIYSVGGLELNFDTKEVAVDEKPVKLTPIEFKILALLIKNPGRVFAADEIYERVWNEQAINTDTIMVHIRKIREKIEINPKNPKYLKVVWGVGYKIEKQ